MSQKKVSDTISPEMVSDAILAVCLAIGVAIAGAAQAQAPSDFRSAAPIAPVPGDALQRFTMPFEIYRDARADLADVRIFNASGEAMPMAYAGIPDPHTQTTQAPAVTLPIFPLHEPAQRAAGSDLAARVDISVNGAVVTVRGAKPPASANRPAREVVWLLDASQLKTPIRALLVDWNAGPGNEAFFVTVESSDDLRSWSVVASRAPILRVQQDGRELAQRQVALRGIQAKYLRLTADRSAFELRNVQAEPAPTTTTRAVARSERTVQGVPGAKANEYVFDLGARLPVEAVRLKLAATNSVAPMTLFVRETPTAEQSRRVIDATFYWLVRDGVEYSNPAMEVGRVTARSWVARLDEGAPAPGGGPPSLTVEWRPAQAIFVARGDGPFTLAFGKADAKPSVLQVSQLMPGYERGAELKLREATVGEVRTGQVATDWIASVTGGANPKKVVLWAVLIAAVIVLAAMAWKIAK